MNIIKKWTWYIFTLRRISDENLSILFYTYFAYPMLGVKQTSTVFLMLRDKCQSAIAGDK